VHPAISIPRPKTGGFDTSEVVIILDSTGNPTSRLRAKLLGHTGKIMNVQVGTALGPSLLVSIAGEIDTPTGRQPLLGKYVVRTCSLIGPGKYQVDLYQEESGYQPPPPQREASRPAEDADYYEVLQVNRRADMDTIHRVFHMLAQRYHPDNRDTGNPDRFRQVAEAHAVLSDASRRAAYDVRLAEEDKSRIKIFDSLESTQGVQAEVRKRQGILRILYTKRITDPHSPAMKGRDFVEMLGCPAEHLEFSLWFLRDMKLITRGDNNSFEITGHGVTAFEADESNFAKKPILTLPAASKGMD
jgi:hypothetical protein